MFIIIISQLVPFHLLSNAPRPTFCEIPNTLIYIVLFHIPWVLFQLLSMFSDCDALMSAQSQ